MATKKVHVMYDGKRVGDLWDFGTETGFEYSAQFLSSGMELSPVKMPLGAGVFRRYDRAFEYLPGIFCDSLPDSYGRGIAKDWFARKMGDQYVVTAADMLSYVGHNGIGALSYEPAHEEYDRAALKELDLAKAEQDVRTYLEGNAEDVLDSLRASAKTVGGACPKALIAVDPATGRSYEERPGLPSNYEHWIVKFGRGKKRRPKDFSHYPEVEMAYLDMARDCGISVPAFRAFETTDRDGQKLVHLGVRRFDLEAGRRLHYASLAGLDEKKVDDDYWGYSDLFRVTEQVVANFEATEEQCRRMIFNVASANVDDHAKNHGFLYDGKTWRPSPAFDLAYWGFERNRPQSLHVKAIIKRIPFSSMKKLGVEAGADEKKIDEMRDRTRTVLEKASDYLAKYNLPPEDIRYITDDLRERIKTSLDDGKTTVALGRGL